MVLCVVMRCVVNCYEMLNVLLPKHNILSMYKQLHSIHPNLLITHYLVLLCGFYFFQGSQSTSMTLNEYQQMDNWAKASEKGYSCYRPTKKGFIDNLTTGKYLTL